MKFHCPHCNQSYEGNAENIGMKYKCDYCLREFTFISEENKVDIFAQDTKKQHKPCPFCGEQILLVAKKCRYCGEFVDSNLASKKYDRGKYVCYALFFGNFGAHCFYANRINKGWMHFILFAASLITPAVFVGIEGGKPAAGFAFFALSAINSLWSIIDAFDDPNSLEK